MFTDLLLFSRQTSGRNIPCLLQGSNHRYSSRKTECKPFFIMIWILFSSFDLALLIYY